MCDSVLHGIAPIYTKKGYPLYKRWYKKIVNKIYSLTGKKTKTIWDRMKRKSNKI